MKIFQNDLEIPHFVQNDRKLRNKGGGGRRLRRRPPPPTHLPLESPVIPNAVRNLLQIYRTLLKKYTNQ